MSAEKIGSMSRRSALCYDWEVSDYRNWAKTQPNQCFVSGPDFVIQNKTFFFHWNNGLPGEAMRIWIGCRSAPVSLAGFSLSLMGGDLMADTEKLLCSKRKVAYSSVLLVSTPIAVADLTPKFLPSGELIIRCRIEVESDEVVSDEVNLAKVVLEDGTTLVGDDLRRVVDDQQLAFTDCVLVRFSSRNYN